MPASIVVVIDQSDSMSDNFKFSSAQTDACTFINTMSVGDSFAVIGFSDSASQAYPSSTGLATITGQPDLDAACQAISQLTTLGMTNMGSAVQMADQLLTSTAAPLGIVLLSDGIWNIPPDPVTVAVSSIPIYTIALGDGGYSGGPGSNPYLIVMQTLASNTGGTYYYTPDAFQLAEIYDDIVSQASIAALVTQQKMTTIGNYYTMTPAIVAAGTTQGYFSITWLDPTIQFTGSTPIGRQLTVRLYDPSNNPVTVTPTVAGPGFVFFKMPNPTPGTWNIEVWNSVPGGIQNTVALFEPGSPIVMNLQLNASNNKELNYEVSVTDHGEPIPGLTIETTLERPLRPMAATLSLYKEQLASVVPDPKLLADGVPEDIARFRKLQQTMPSLHPRVVETHQPPVLSGEVYKGTIALPHAGEYTLRCKMTGHSPKTGTDFQRQRRGSTVVC